MNDYIIFMHNDVQEDTVSDNPAAWDRYLAMLRASGLFSGGSSIGNGICVSKTSRLKPITAHLGGYILVRAASLDGVKPLLQGNPVLDAGGTVEIRELPRD